MTKEQLITLVQSNLVGGKANADNTRRFHYKYVEMTIGLFWGGFLGKLKDAGANLDSFYRSVEIELENGQGVLPKAYVSSGTGAAALLAEDMESNVFFYPRKGHSARVVLNSLQASRSMNTFTVIGQLIVFDAKELPCKVKVSMLPSFEDIPKDEPLLLPLGAETILMMALESEYAKYNIPPNNTNDQR